MWIQHNNLIHILDAYKRIIEYLKRLNLSTSTFSLPSYHMRCYHDRATTFSLKSLCNFLLSTVGFLLLTYIPSIHTYISSAFLKYDRPVAYVVGQQVCNDCIFRSKQKTSTMKVRACVYCKPEWPLLQDCFLTERF